MGASMKTRNDFCARTKYISDFMRDDNSKLNFCWTHTQAIFGLHIMVHIITFRVYYETRVVACVRTKNDTKESKNSDEWIRICLLQRNEIVRRMEKQNVLLFLHVLFPIIKPFSLQHTAWLLPILLLSWWKKYENLLFLVLKFMAMMFAMRTHIIYIII